jgi:hypothetical protein
LIGAVLALRPIGQPFGVAVTASVIGFVALLPFLPALMLILCTGRGRRAVTIDLAVLLTVPLVLWVLAMNGVIPRDPELVIILSVWFFACAGTFVWLRWCGFRLLTAAAGGGE